MKWQGMHRCLDGKKFKLFSLKTLDESSLRLPQYVQALRKNRTLHFKFPSPLGLGLSSTSAVLLSLDRCSISWGGSKVGGVRNEDVPILTSVSLSITMASRIAIVGPNGQGNTAHPWNNRNKWFTLMSMIITGKSTLLNALLSEFSYFPSGKKTATSSKSEVASAIPSARTAKAKPSLPLPLPPSSSQALLSIPRSGGTVTSLPSNKTKAVKNLVADASSSPDMQVRPGGVVLRGSCFSYHNLRVAIVSQHHIDAMSDHLLVSPLTYCTSTLQDMIDQSIRSGFR